jgi:hypothetical protein
LPFVRLAEERLAFPDRDLPVPDAQLGEREIVPLGGECDGDHATDESEEREEDPATLHDRGA